MTALGVHLLMAARVERVEYGHRALLAIMRAIARRFGMRPIGGSVTDHHWGPSGWLMLSESHIAFDYFFGDTPEPCVTVDFFSCGIYDPMVAAGYIADRFHMVEPMERHIIMRGSGIALEDTPYE